MVWSITCKWWWKVCIVCSYRHLYGAMHKSGRWEGIHRRYPIDPWCVYLTYVINAQVLFTLCASPHARNRVESKQDPTFVHHLHLYLWWITQSNFVGDQLQDRIRSWLSPPDPLTNYNTARKAHHPDTSTWFIQGDTFKQWKSTGSLLWVQGLRANFSFASRRTTHSFWFIAGSGKTIISYVTTSILHSLCSCQRQF
jgi:hypothetical protein